ncbi:MAG: AraC family transcriptional regulator [Oceanospirillaceae bacterium]|nr:AraC family transcriptional regulator [Oceanospirillaceae bacterium]
MQIAIVTFDGFNELDSLIALGVLNRIKLPGWRVLIASPDEFVTSMNGVVMKSHLSLESASSADAVLIGSGSKTREIAKDGRLMERLSLDPSRQLIGAQCSGSLILSRLGLLEGVPACTDVTTRPWVEQQGVRVLDQAFFAQGNIATAGGCLASTYMAAWLIGRLVNRQAAEEAIDYVAPVGEKTVYVEQVMKNVAMSLRG